MNTWRAIQFMVTVFSIWGGSNLYMAARLIGPAGLTGPARLAAWAGSLALTVLVPVTMVRQRRRGPRRKAAGVLTWVAYLYMGFAAILLPLVMLRDLAWFAVRALAWAGGWPGAVPAWALNASGLTVLGLAGLMTLAGFIEARRNPRVTRLSLPVPGLSAALEGFRIAHVSDLHAGGTITRDRLAHVVGEVNAFTPDLVALTGDLADGHVAELRDHVAPIADLKARHGVFFSTGNHEYYWDPQGWLAHVRELGLTVLMNEHRVLRHGDATVVVAGVPDPTAYETEAAHVTDPDGARTGAPACEFSILLAHQPGTAPAGAAAGFDLQLTGHTHGGQFFPWSHLVGRVQPFLKGLHRVGAMWLYVNRGAGYWGPPNRLGVPSEIALLTLVRA